jgi:hypothetical protein
MYHETNPQYTSDSSRNDWDKLEKRGLTLKEAASLAGISINTFKKAQKQGKFPGPTLPGKRYDRRLLQDAMDRLSGINDRQTLTPLDRWRASRNGTH